MINWWRNFWCRRNHGKHWRRTNWHSSYCLKCKSNWLQAVVDKEGK